MAFKMKRPMIMGTPIHKHAVSSALKQDEERRGDDEVRRMIEEGTKLKDNKKSEKKKEEKAPSAYEAAKKKDPKLDTYIATRNDPNASEMEKAKAQDAINAAYGRGPTNRAEKLKTKADTQPKKEEPKKDSSKSAEKADTSKGTNMDKIAEGKKPEGTEKAGRSEGRMKPGDPGYMKLPESEKLKIQRAAKARHKKAIEAWRSGGRKGRRPRRKDYY